MGLGPRTQTRRTWLRAVSQRMSRDEGEWPQETPASLSPSGLTPSFLTSSHLVHPQPGPPYWE